MKQINKFAAAKARKPCLWTWKITSKALQTDLFQLNCC